LNPTLAETEEQKQQDAVQAVAEGAITEPR